LFEAGFEFLFGGQVELIFLNEKLAVHLVGGVFHEQFILVAGEDDADGRVVARGVFLGGEVAEIHIHLADVVVLNLVDFEVDEDEAAEDAVVEDEVHPVVGVVEGDAILSANESEAFAQLQQEGLEVVAEAGFQVGLGKGVWLGDFEKFEDEGVAEDV